MTITVQRTISMGHRLASYNGICSSLHGHNVRFVATFEVGDLFVDFKHMDQSLQVELEPLDHAMVLEYSDPVVKAVSSIPGQRIVLLNVEPTTEALAQYVFNRLQRLDVVSVTVHETDKYSATVINGLRNVHREL